MHSAKNRNVKDHIKSIKGYNNIKAIELIFNLPIKIIRKKVHLAQLRVHKHKRKFIDYD